MDLKFLLIFFAFCNVNFSQINMNQDIVHGIKNPDLIGDTIKLEKNTFHAFNKMKKAANEDGINLKIASAYRSYERQKFIWNKKFNRFTIENSFTPTQAINEIIRFSTIPGTSRHHWGTEIDIIDGDYLDEENVLMGDKFKKGGVFYKVKKWLDSNSEKFGFYITYNNDPNRKGFEHEPWHYSYAPVSKKMLILFLESDLKNIIKKKEILGSDYFTDKFIKKYKNDYILDINPYLK